MKRRGQKLFARLVTLLMVCLLVPVFAMVASADEPQDAPAAACYLHGDVNGDGYVDSRDAIKTLYHSMLKDAVNQNCDFDGDGEVTAEDAVYLLYASLNIVEGYDLKGNVHVYQEPEWTWKDGTATMALNCACGQANRSAEAIVSETEVTAATCTVDGQVTYEATATIDGQVYTDRKTVTIAAVGHTLVGELTCTSGIICTNDGCNYVVEPLNHVWEEDKDNSSAATCQSGAVQAYKCARGCGEMKSVTTSEAGEHSYVASEYVDGCAHTKVFTCAYCQDTYNGETAYNHTYTATMTQEANCMETGVKTFTCTVCRESYTENVETNGVHIWNDGTTTDGLTTYACTVDGCNATKSAAVYKEQTEAAVSTDVLANSELQLKDATVSLDEKVLEQVSEQTEITIEVKPATNVPAMDAALAAQITGTVYDFNMSAGGQEITKFDGLVTVSIPYTLQEGDDPDCIDVWYIDGEGNVTVVEGAYSNGQVTFSTNHFSYYTVTRLTAEQRCATYGHVMVEKYKAATCTSDGYDVAFCQRCAYEAKNDILTKLGHDLVDTSKAATCEEAGSVSKACNREGCLYVESATLEALGHAWYLSDEKAASCTENGVQTFACSVCEDSYTAELPKMPHSYEASVTEPTCTSKGYTTWTCSVCGDSYVGDETAAKGHSYQAAWTWAEDNSSATVTLTCEHDAAHLQTLEAVVSKVVKGASCTAKGEVTYTAAVSYNMQQYTDTKTVELAVKGHTPGEVWESNANKHYHICENCGEQVDVVEHVWGETQVTEAPTCIYVGSGVIPCTVCGYEQKTSIPATGEHNMVNGSCKDCGFRNSSCSHVRTYESPIDMTEYGVCEGWDVRKFTCDCGEYSYVEIHGLGCDLRERDPRKETTEDGWTYDVWIRECIDCGLVYEYAWYPKLLDADSCHTGYADYVKLVDGDGNVIVDSEFVSPYMQLYHATFPVGERVDVTQYGLCGGEIWTYQCHCGAFNNSYIENAVCEWIEDEENSTEEIRISTCAVCGTMQTRESLGTVKENCMWQDSYKITYTNASKTFSLTNVIGGATHDFRTTEYELSGDSCEDGLYYVQTCADCGTTREQFVRYHESVIWTDEDMSAYDICYDTFRTYVCPCGEYTWAQMMGEETWCQMDHLGVDEATGVETWQCSECGLIHETYETYGEKDAHCEHAIYEHHTFKTAEGEQVASYTQNYISVDHNYVTTWELVVPGGSCEDGVIETETCADCGNSYTNTYEHHNIYEMERYDVADYGMCGGTLVVYSCVCGRDAWVEWHDCNCMWEHIDHNRISSTHYITTEYCAGCDTYREHEYNKEYLADSCKVKETRKYTYYRDDVKLLTVSAEPTYDDHRAIYTYDENAKCEEGGIVYYTCLKCGEIGEIEYYCNGYHGWWEVEREEILPEGTLCGGMDLATMRCACGEDEATFVSWFGGACNFQDQWDEEGNYRYACTECGAVRDSIVDGHYVSDDSCEWVYENHYTITLNGEVVAEYTTSSTDVRHDDRCTFETLGDTCEDGYYVHRTCVRCGYQEEPEYSTEDWSWWNGERVIYDGEGLCGPIRLNQYIHPFGNINEEMEMACTWNWYWDEEKDMEIGTCSRCGSSVERDAEGDYVSDDSCLWVNTSHYTCYDRDGNELVCFDRVSSYRNHIRVASFEMLGDTCEDGYYLTKTCIKCGDAYTEEEPHYDCEYFRTGWETVLRSDALCGDVIIQTNSTPCGLIDSWISDDCAWEWNYNEKTDEEYEFCQNCGATRTSVSESEPDPENSCRRIHTTTYTYCDQAGNELGTVTLEDLRDWHDYLYSFNMLGNSCDDGYYLIATCTRCDYSYTADELYHGCNTWETEKELIYEGEGLCGSVYLVTHRCPCGDMYDKFHDDACDMQWGYDEAIGEYQYCTVCGTRANNYSIDNRIENSCDVNRTVYCNYTSAAGEELFKGETSYTKKQHVEVWTLTLDNPDGTCEDGYTAVANCVYCGEQTAVENGNGHGTYRTMQYNMADYGLCGGEYRYYSCACGEHSHWGDALYNCNWEYIEENDDGVETYYCGQCETYRYRAYSSYNDRENCIRHATVSEKFVRNNQTVLEFTWNTQDDNHVYLMESYSGSCEEGFEAYMVCKFCGDSTYEGCGAHGTVTTNYIDLSELDGCCGGELYYVSCPCGEESGINWNLTGHTMETEWRYETIDGLEHQFEERTCENCALSMLRETWYIWDKETCTETGHQNYTVSYGEQELASCYNTWDNERHDYSYVYSLLAGSESCDDGTLVTRTCKTCAHQNSYESSGHNTNLKESLDLTQYGAVCKTTLDKYGCACGERTHYELGGEAKCDMGEVYVDAWIDNSLDESQYTANDYQGYWSYFNELTCAVTDPQCAFKMRKADYWLEDAATCTATRYCSWDYYDGTQWVNLVTDEIEKKAHHDYVTSDIDETLENGTEVSGTMYTCSVCDSTYAYRKYYDADTGDRMRYEHEAINNLDDGRNRYWLGRNSYMTVNGHSVPVEYYHEYIYADNTTYWYRNSFTYETDPCIRYETYENSNGESDTYTMAHGSEYYYGENRISYATCSQFDEYEDIYHCVFCDAETNRYSYKEMPYGHYWYQSENEEGEIYYYCGRCGLENSNGADGSIVLEDLSDYKTGDEYVAGYWNRGNVDYTVVVNLVTYDTEGNEVVTQLDVEVSEDDTYVAKVFSMDAAYTAACEALGVESMSGVNGTDYFFRIIFVSNESGEALDYALTFIPEQY